MSLVFLPNLKVLNPQGASQQECKMSCRYLEGLVQAEVDSGTPLQSIAVAGFSQGGCIALMMLRSKLNVSGIAGGFNNLV